MAGLIVEGGIYFLLLFTPFAFGGVEMWAQGVVQIVAGLVFVAWAWEKMGAHRTGGGRPSGAAWALKLLWSCIGLFLALVLVQLVPMPPGWIRSLSPGTYDLYARTLPGYTQGRDFETAALASWLLEGARDSLPPAGDPDAEAAVVVPPLPASGFPLRASAWRSLSIFPFETRQRLSILLSYVGLFAVASGHFHAKERLRRLAGVLVFAGFALSMFGIIQKLTWNGKLYWVREGMYGDVFGAFVNRNSYAAFAGTVLPLAICMALASLRQIEKGHPGALPRFLLWGFAAVTIAGGIFYSLSRGGILACLLSLLIIAGMVILYGRGGKELAALGALAVAAAAFLIWIGPEKVMERVGTLSQGQSVPSLAMRIGVWKRIPGLITDHLFFGTGLGTFRFAFMRWAPPGEGWWTHADNEYLELVCDTGLVGAAIFLVGLTAYVALVAKPARIPEGTERYAYIGIVAGLLGLLVHSAISSNLQVPANGLLLVILGASLLCLVRKKERPFSRPRPIASRPTAPVAPVHTLERR